MKEITLILFSSVIIPFIAPTKYKKQSCFIALFLLFFVWAFQYKMTCDWDVYVERWKIATEGYRTSSLRTLEWFYVFVMNLCKPVGFFSYLILCAIFSCFVIWIYLKKYVQENYFWLFFATFSLNCAFLLEMIDTNRQTFAMMLVMVAVYIMSNFAELNWRNKYVMISAFLIFLAFNTHKSAIISFPILLFPYLIQFIKDSRYLYVFLIIDVLSFFLDFSKISLYFESQMMTTEDLSFFSQYTIDIAERSKSIIEQSIYMIIIILLVHNFDKFKNNEKPLILSVLIFCSLQGYAMYTMLRVLSYYKIFLTFVIPILLYRVQPFHNKKIQYVSYFFVFFYVSYQIFRYSVDIHVANYEGYEQFNTLFSAQKWM